MDQLSFENLNLSPQLSRAIADAGYTQMTGIQQKVIPLISQGLDVIGQSSTGTGKTAAFGIPAIEMIEADETANPSVLVLCPTRELALQVSDELRKFSKYKEGVRVVTVYGGQSIDTQIRALKRSSIVVGTPGRIIDHLRRRTLKLGDIKMVVLDEADEMLDMGFLGDIKQILFNTPKERQTVLFSATMPKEIMRITQQFQRNPQHIKGDDGQTAFGLIDQYYVEVPQKKKALATGLIFRQYGAKRGLIFCNTKIMVDKLTRALEQSGLSACALHGDMRQALRSKVMKSFKEGEINLLVATDVAARGIDASGVDIIINYDIPQDIEYYVHRIGRTGRAGADGAAFTLVAGSGEFFGLRDIEVATGQSLKPYNLLGIDEGPDDAISSSKSSSRSEKDSGKSRGSSADMAEIAIDVGSDHDITRSHILESLEKYAKIKGSNVGKISISAQETTVELPFAAARAYVASSDITVDDFVVAPKLTKSPSPTNAGSPRRSQNSGRSGHSGFRGGRRPRR